MNILPHRHNKNRLGLQVLFEHSAERAQIPRALDISVALSRALRHNFGVQRGRPGGTSRDPSLFGFILMCQNNRIPYIRTQDRTTIYRNSWVFNIIVNRSKPSMFGSSGCQIDTSMYFWYLKLKPGTQKAQGLAETLAPA